MSNKILVLFFSIMSVHILAMNFDTHRFSARCTPECYIFFRQHGWIANVIRVSKPNGHNNINQSSVRIIERLYNSPGVYFLVFFPELLAYESVRCYLTDNEHQVFTSASRMLLGFVQNYAHLQIYKVEHPDLLQSIVVGSVVEE